ncbi:hypothetical protein EU537_07470, partial [Candidatus Thorarchaeota archaeon]
MRKLVLVFILAMVLVIAAGEEDVGPSASLEVEEQAHASSYTPHAPITITSNADFAAQGWPGSGTKGDPYVIEGLNITDERHCIDIRETTVHFLIRNCLLSSYEYTITSGVIFLNVTHGSVIDCSIEYHDQGIHLADSTNCVLTNNTVTEARDGSGIVLNRAHNNTLAYNRAIRNYYHGIVIYYSDNCTIEHNTASENSRDGVSLDTSSNCTLMNNTLSNNSNSGIEVERSQSCALINNSVTNNSLHAIYLKCAVDSTLTDNTLEGNGLFIWGFDVSNWLHNMSGNTVNGKPLGYLTHLVGASLDVGAYGQLIVVNCSSSIFEHGVVNSATVGFQIAYSEDCKVTDSLASHNCAYGFHICYSDNFSITNSTAMNNRYGLYIEFSQNCFIENNTATDNSEYGFHLSFSYNCSLTNNTAANNENGFYFQCSDEGTLTNNTAYCNVKGFYLHDSDNLALRNNTFISNGIYIEGASVSDWILDASGNKVNGKRLGYFKNLNGSVINALQFGQVILANCSNTTVNDGRFNNATIGVLIGYSTNCTLQNNTAMRNFDSGFRLINSRNCTLTNNTVGESWRYGSAGFYLLSSDNCSLVKNTVIGVFYAYHLTMSGDCNLTDNKAIDSGSGFFLRESPKCSFVGNAADNNQYGGFDFWDSFDCILEGNTAKNNSGNGFFLRSSNSCALKDNSASNNTGHGFYAYDSTTNCIFRKNTAAYNSYEGFYIDHNSNHCNLTGNSAIYNYGDGFVLSSANCRLIHNIATNNTENGIRLLDADNSTIANNTVATNEDYGIFAEIYSSENQIHYNILWGNTGNARDDGSLNIWDDGVSLGNFWDDFQGIGNHSINGAAESVDRYPYNIEAYYSVALNHPDDIEYEVGTTGHNITWIPADPYPAYYTIYSNGSQIVSESWNGTVILIDVDGLAVGIYNYTLEVSDTSGNTAADTVIVTVTSSNTTTTTQTTTETSSTEPEG